MIDVFDSLKGLFDKLIELLDFMIRVCLNESVVINNILFFILI